jgi:hypothetical protein
MYVMLGSPFLLGFGYAGIGGLQQPLQVGFLGFGQK